MDKSIAKPYRNQPVCMNNVPESKLNNYSTVRRTAFLSSRVGSYYYVVNVNRARIKRCIQSKLKKCSEENFSLEN